MPRRRPTKWLEARRRGVSAAAPDWLGRALPRAGVLPFAEAEAAIRAGRVTISGRAVREPFSAVRPGDAVAVDGARVSLAGRTLCLAFHKPAGAVTSTRDEHGGGTVFDALARALPPALARYGWHAIGRLDRDTTGLLLFTNDEKLVEHATSPKAHLPKRYVAEVQGRAEDAALEPIRRGLTLDDGPARPAKARVLADGRVELILTEGRHHQVKRMLGAVGLPVRALHRAAIGGLELDVEEGAVRVVGDDEVRSLLGFEPRAFGGG